MNQQEIIEKVIDFVKSEVEHYDAGHDWWHIYRVWKLSQQISVHEEVDQFIVEIGALLHDIGEPKFHGGDESIGEKKIRGFLNELHIEQDIIEHVVNILNNISYKKTLESHVDEHGEEIIRFMSPELAVIQDADRLDSMGAIGIARTFSYGGFNNREMYNPNIKPNLNQSKEEYKKGGGPTINHFYEKLLLLKDLINTETGKRLAEGRHQYMEKYLHQFYHEWEGDL